MSGNSETHATLGKDNNNMLNIRQSAQKLLQRLQSGASKPPVELIYASHARWPLSYSESHPNSNAPTRIAILDSSFNPPTLAHLALANAGRPDDWAKEDNGHDYDAKLLLLSVKNVDKSLKPGDATYLQRLELMSLLAKDVRLIIPQLSKREVHPNVAIAIVDEPTFVGKSEALLGFLKHRFATLSLQPPADDVELTFLVGLDTLERLFSARYYPSESTMMASLRKLFAPGPEGDNSRVACAKRVFSTPATLNSPGETEAAKALELSKEFEDAGRIAIIDIGENLSTYSSSAVRSVIGRDGLEPKGGEPPVWRNFVTEEVADYISHERLYEQGGT